MISIIRSAAMLLAGACMATTLSGCDVHEFPDEPDEATLCLTLHFATDMPQWEYPITDSRTVIPSRVVQTDGQMRYIIRLYPGSADSRALTSRAEPLHEFVFTRSVADGYDAHFVLDDVPTGDYTIMAWADLAADDADAPFYDADNFGRIKLQATNHPGCNDYRDAFRGSSDISFKSNFLVRGDGEATIEMQRPLAKFEFVTTDLEEFIDKEIKAALSRGDIDTESVENAPSRFLDMSKYKIVLYYVGFMPNTFNIFTDKPSDSATGISFPGRFTRLSDHEASLGFDYVFVNGVESKVSLQIGIFDADGNRLSMTSPIDVPLRRSQHTLLKGRFLMQNASGGVGIDPSFSGEHNIFI